ncbi:ribonuclease R [Geopsychrobacter electrodiphilus]|uniref:ribonuclease R n=1 Tax=Geopsychrobacter electrodiphilus TaxID=225196 RepID=UPI00036CF2E8|nr:ribonuclease R [Geopsychrobacter electrodiphilus]
MQPIEQKIIDLLAQGTKKPLSRREISEHLNLRGGERKLLTRCLEQLVKSGTLQERKGGYRLRQSQQRTLEGVFSLAEKGYGFVRPDDAQGEDLFIPARHVDTAMDGDRVLVALAVSARDRRPYAKVINVLQRAHSRLVGQYRIRGKSAQVFPQNKKLGGPVQVPPHPDANPGDLVEVEIEYYPHGEFNASGWIIEVLGVAGDPRVDIESAIRTHGLPHQFSSAALAQAGRIGECIDPAEIARRTDLRQLPLVTIDGETARDFDDAVALKKTASGYTLWVCIADVSYYVEPQSALDNDALERGTSVYFPGFCLPMLPEALSNGICSLNPEEDRLVMCAELQFDLKGNRQQSNFYPAVMRSQARLTYTSVAACLDDPQTSELPAGLIAQLQQMAQLAAALREMRRARGSLDMDLPEVEILLDESGAPFELIKTERTLAHRLIEEFMLAANEAVAEYLTRKKRNLLYRIHEEPDPLKLQDLQQLAAECGVGLVLGKNLQKSLQQLLLDIADKPEARMVNQQLLRSLKQACYAPQNAGHFGLAAAHYCHFTSPIRRYPDLIIHRILKQTLAPDPHSSAISEAELVTLGFDTSAKERRAMQAERDLADLRRCQIMEKHLGEEFDGTISSVAEFGFFVELDDLFVDGLVPVRSLQDDFYHFDAARLALVGERRRHEYKIGTRVRVKVAKVELGRRRIDFSLISTK